MLTTQEIQKLLNTVNFDWVNHEIFIEGMHEIRDTSAYTMYFSLLTEILSKLERIEAILYEKEKEGK